MLEQKRLDMDYRKNESIYDPLKEAEEAYSIISQFVKEIVLIVNTHFPGLIAPEPYYLKYYSEFHPFKK